MDNFTRANFERIADEMEAVARTMPKDTEHAENERAEVFGMAWDLKQIARKGTASEGI